MTIHTSAKTFKSLLSVAAMSLPVVLYVFRFGVVYRNGIFHGEDWDYFAQAYQAARQTLLHYHQFPWWNPWSMGGVPLFANPQFGLFSIPMGLVLLIGTLPGLHTSVFAYFLLGFWGMYLLLRRLGSSSRLTSALLAYIWVFSGFSAYHIGVGHFTFAVYLISPWAFLTVFNIREQLGWLWFGLSASVLIQAAAHYLTIETLLICVAIGSIQIIRQLYAAHTKTFMTIAYILRPYLLAFLLIIIINGFRLFYVFQFSHEYPKVEPLDPSESLNLLIVSLTSRHLINPSSLSLAPYGWWEYADYFGIITIGLFAYLVIRRLDALRLTPLKEWFILVATMLAVLITLGSFSSFSPFSLLHHLPIFNQMRVPSRFICWAAFGVIIFLRKLPQRPVVYMLLTLSVVDVFLVNYPVLNYSQRPFIQTIDLSSQFEQYEFFGTSPSLGQQNIMALQNLRLMRATESNKGEIYSYEPILDAGEYYFLPGTNLCGINNGCAFVLSHNARVSYWSPGKVVLARTGSGPIHLDMNPGKVWYVNGRPAFKGRRVLELQKDFVINDPSRHIEIAFKPAP